MKIKSKREDGTELKSFCTLEVKDAEKGEVEAIVATLGVVDKDEEIIRPGAIADGSKVTMSAYGHDAVFGARPVGKGKLSIEGNKVVFKGRMFLAMTEARETFECLKGMQGDQEWSFGFNVVGSELPSADEKRRGARRVLTKLDSFEVSPVLIGAGIGTQTVGVKHDSPAAKETAPTPDAASDAAPDPAPDTLADAVPPATVEETPADAAPESPAEEQESSDATAAEAARIAGEAEAKARADREAEAFKARTLEAVGEFERVQRTLKRLQFI
jgi:hypothetical protein